MIRSTEEGLPDQKLLIISLLLIHTFKLPLRMLSPSQALIAACGRGLTQSGVGTEGSLQQTYDWRILAWLKGAQLALTLLAGLVARTASFPDADCLENHPYSYLSKLFSLTSKLGNSYLRCYFLSPQEPGNWGDGWSLVLPSLL